MTDMIGEFARSYWPVIGGTLLAAVAWGANTALIGIIADGNRAINAKLDKLSDQQSNFQATVASTQALEQANARALADLSEWRRAVEARR